MEIALLIKSIIGLVFILGFLIFVLILPSKKQKEIQRKKEIQRQESIKKAKEKNALENEGMKTDLTSLREVIKNKKSDESTLKEALEMVIKYHGTINKKLGVRTHPDFEIYKDILFTICRHPNTNKHLIINFDKELGKLNPSYKAEINDALTRGLNSRGV